MVKLYYSTDRAHQKAANVRGEEQLYVAASDTEMTGYCKYRLSEKKLVLVDLYEADGDIVMADALVRAAAAHYRDKVTCVECGRGGLLPVYRKYSGLYIDNSCERIENVLRGSCGL